MPFSNALNDKIIWLQAEICAVEDLISERNKFILDLQGDFLCMLVRKVSFEALVSAGYGYEPEELGMYERMCSMWLDIETWVQQARDRIADDEKEFDSLWEQLHKAVLMEQ